ncbi:MAG: cobamide remodeling phosphodiesterase CbiR [Verrucomicrobiota bacterium]
MMKGRFPFRLGTTSFILRDDILPNVHYLKDRVDHVELLVFETDASYPYPNRETVAELQAIGAEHETTYTVHLPIGIKLGSSDEKRRRKDVDAVLRAYEAMRALSPIAWDLHLERNDNRPHDGLAWQAACLKSLDELKAGGLDPAQTGIETLEFDFTETVPLLDATGFAITLDIGHVWYRDYDEAKYLELYLPRAVSIHLHGFNQERDHKGLQHVPRPRLERFLDAVAKHPQASKLPVSVEVFDPDSFNQSMETLNEIA